MASPPTTPPAELQAGEKFWRFNQTGAICEWIELYRPGGFHPVNLGDTFHDGKYKVIRKLGNGSYSTVWLAVSTSTPRYVALKIMVARAPSGATTTELRILDHLSKQASIDTRAQHVIVLLDSFQHQGVNGTHQCLVFEPMGQTATALVEELPENKSKKYEEARRYPKWMAKKILLHALRGIAFLHQNGVVHGSFHPGNLLFSMEDISSIGEDELKQDEASAKMGINRTDTVPVTRIDGKIDRWAPKNLYHGQPLTDRVQLGPGFCVKVSDLGSAFWLNDPPSDADTPISLRAPELILHQPFGFGIDMWSFGCLIFEFVTGEERLFSVGVFGHSQEDRDDADDDHLLQLYDIIGPLPDSIMAAWPRASTWFTPDRKPLNPYGEGEELYIHPSLEKKFAKSKPADVDDEESAVLCSLMRQILDYDPAKRPSAEDVLKHPWFSEEAEVDPVKGP